MNFLNGAAISPAAGSTLPARCLFASGADAAEQLLYASVPDGLPNRVQKRMVTA